VDQCVKRVLLFTSIAKPGAIAQRQHPGRDIGSHCLTSRKIPTSPPASNAACRSRWRRARVIARLGGTRVILVRFRYSATIWNTRSIVHANNSAQTVRGFNVVPFVRLDIAKPASAIPPANKTGEPDANSRRARCVYLVPRP
jgi:hypothetical protein